MVRGPRSKHQGPWSTDLEPWIVDSVSRIKLRGSRLVDARPGLLELVARSGSNWLEGWGLGLAGARGSDIGRVMDGGRRESLVLVGCAARFKSSPPHATLSAHTGAAIPPDGGFLDGARPQRTGEAAPYRLRQSGFHRQLHHVSLRRYDPRGQKRSRNIARQAQWPWSVATADR